MNHQLDQEVVAGFISEAKGYLPEIMLGLEAFAADSEQLGSLREAFRFAHIIKGAASMLGFMQISEVAYQLEITLEMLCEEHLPLTPEMLEDLCQRIGELADLLDQGLRDVPYTEAEKPAGETPGAELLSPLPSLPELSDIGSSAEETNDTSESLAFSSPGVALTPSLYEEKGETILLEEDVLPEVADTWSAQLPAELQSEEPLVALLNDASYPLSLPETDSTPTIGDLDMANVAQELKESFSGSPLPPQPEFALPDELMTGLPDLQFDSSAVPAPQPEAPITGEASVEGGAEALLEMPEDDAVTDTSVPAFEHPADQLAADLLTVPAVSDEVLVPEANWPLPDLCSDPTPMDQPAAETPLPATCEETVEEGSVDQGWPDLTLPSLADVALVTALPAPLAEDTVAQEPTDERRVVSTLPDNPAPSLLPAPHASLSAEMAEELMETFLLEAEEHLQNLHTSFRVLYKNPDNRDLLQQVRRSSHSLKGTAAMVGLDNIMQLAHRMEDVLDLIWDGEMQLTTERTLLLMQATDALEDMSNGQTNAEEVQRLYAEFARVLSGDFSVPAVEPVAEPVPEPTLEWTAETRLEAELAAPPLDEDDLVSVPAFSPALEAETLPDLSADLSSELLPELSSDLLLDEVAEGTPESEPECTEVNVGDEPALLELESEPVLLAEAEAQASLHEVLTPADASVLEEPAFLNLPLPEVPAANSTVDDPLAAVPEAQIEALVEAAAKAETNVQTNAEMKVEAVRPQPAAGTASTLEPEVTPAAPAGTMAQTSSQFVRVPIERLDEIVKLISEMIITRTTFEQRLADFARQVEELQIAGTRLRRASSNLESKYEASTLGGGRPALLPSNIPSGLVALAANGLVNSLVTHNTYGFDDLEFDRYTEFHLVSRELVESSTDIQTLGRELGHLNGDFLGYLNRQGRIYSELQDRLMRLRMVPLGNLGPRLHRTVRTVAVQQGKDVELILEGETTALDTTALQEMTDPLLHLLRNAVDHGIEVPDARVAKGKAPLGKITLRAFYEGSQVVIQLRDDGQGLDAHRIRNKAIEYGLLTATEAEALAAPELWPLIFTPGFSTASQVSEISGRGVGMDVVHATVQKLKGTVTIDSQPSAGTTFTIRLPLTLAVTRSLMVKANGQSFAIPLDVVTQIMRLEMSKVERIGKEPVIRLGGKVYPLLMLSRLLNLRQSGDEVSARPPALLLNVEGKEIVVIVDQLLGGREVVIKTLGNHLRKVHGVMGATLMGDGEVVLILNLAELLRGTVRRLTRRSTPALVGAMTTVPTALPAEAVPAPVSEAAPASRTEKKTLTIMVVDDSPSVRRVSTNMIKSVGWVPVQAKDGLDALEQIQSSETPPDLILLDIEMPRMDGYQFLSSIRSLSAYRHLPVVIVSSRSSEKHRQKAFDVGATDYLVKPYQEDNVIALIQRLVKKGHQ